MSRKKDRKNRKFKSRKISHRSSISGKSRLRLAKSKTNGDSASSALILAENFYKTNQEHKIAEALSVIPPESLKPYSPEHFRYLTLKAIGLSFSGELIEAESACQQGLQSYPEALDFYYLLTFLKLSMREYAGAIEFGEKYIQVLRFKPVLEDMPLPLCGMMAHLSQLQNMLGNAYREQNKIDEATRCYEAAILADPANHLPYLNLSTMQNHLGNQDGARKSISAGLEKCVQVQELRMLEQSFKNKQTISACMIVKDEEKLLPGCLDSIRDWVDEIVIVDTGSNDKTVSIALSYGAKVFNQQWEGNFSKHRNFSMEKATSDWIFIIDADERTCNEDVTRLKELINSGQHSIISVNVFNVYGKDETMTTFLPSVRLFKRDLNLRYEGIVHNRLVFPEDATIARANVKIKHLGYDLNPDQMRKKFERSHALLEKQLQKNPNDAFALFNMAQLLRGAGKDKPGFFSEEIIRHATKAVSLTNPKEMNTRNIHLMSLDQLAWAHFYKGNLKQALSFAETALSHKKNYLDPLLLLGHVYTQSKEYEKAKSAYKLYLEVQSKYDPTSEKDNIILVNPDSRATAFYGLGLLAELTNKFKEARAYYQKTLQLNPNHLDVKQRMSEIERSGELSISAITEGSKCLDQNREEAAETFFLKALEESSDKRTAVEEIANIYFGKEQFQESIRYYQIWLDKNPDDAGILNDMANCYFKLNQHEQALKYYETASELPNAPDLVFRNMGLTCSKLKQYGKAIIAFRKYLETKPDDLEIISIMADICMQVGDFRTAMPLYEKSLRSNPTDIHAIFNLSECYLNMGHENSARIGYNRVLELNPHFELAKKRLAQLEEVTSALS